MRAREIMTSPVITLRENDTLATAARILVEKRVSGLPILDAEGKLVGVLTMTDLTPRDGEVPHSDVKAIQLFRRWLGPGGIAEAYGEAEKIPLKDVMQVDLVTAAPDAEIEHVARLMLDNGVNHIPIVEGERVVGIVTRHDYLRLAATR